MQSACEYSKVFINDTNSFMQAYLELSLVA